MYEQRSAVIIIPYERSSTMTLTLPHYGISVLVVLVALFAVGCAGGGINPPVGSPQTTDQSSIQNTELSKINPCSLFTNEEIAAQVDLTLEPHQREAKRQMGVKHKISSKLEEGMPTVCLFSWRSVDSKGEELYRGEFEVHVITAQQMVEFPALKRKQTIASVGDEAFHDGYRAYARVGKVGIDIENFPDTYEGEGRVELLRAAVRRLQSSGH
jgi:hypothetical protein